MEKTHTQIKHSISRRKEGEVVFPSEFRGMGTDAAIKQALSRLARQGFIKRLAHGIYYKPKIDTVLGEIRPSADDVIRMVAQKEKIRIKPAGTYALHELGLTTQVPTRRVYITDGHPREFALGKLKIKFKGTTPKRLMRQGKISSLVIQALEELGTENIDKDIKQKIRALLMQENQQKLKHDLRLAPVKVNNYIVQLMKEKQ